ncbi:TetR/AcrR family transcriptional regulator [Wenjunlia tyrosinilytica]|uniref:Transcriptional regulator, TetR family protein n=1 Tax=Wenjunlia tyrosinilytica TaxID=1544741 RepID=A0A917ZSW5_9ACTN|nr:TetR/AcrR family transcriptional regulator [Wenjunlia tyrosinilytica]GGO89928.1 putative transcriptional regulator, TetR family protein [Wenjunlia tyrosinilytica]
MAREDLVEQRRRDITLAAFKVFAQRGYHETGIADIARELGVGHGTFYRYFANKRDIVARVVDMAVERIAEVVASESPELAQTVEEYRAQVERIGRALFDLFIDDPQLARIFFFESAGVDRELSEHMLETNEVFGAVTERYLENGVSKGFLRADLDIPVTARAINGMIFAGALAAFRSGSPASVRDRWSRAVADLIIGGARA